MPQTGPFHKQNDFGFGLQELSKCSIVQDFVQYPLTSSGIADFNDMPARKPIALQKRSKIRTLYRFWRISTGNWLKLVRPNEGVRIVRGHLHWVLSPFSPGTICTYTVIQGCNSAISHRAWHKHCCLFSRVASETGGPVKRDHLMPMPNSFGRACYVAVIIPAL